MRGLCDLLPGYSHAYPQFVDNLEAMNSALRFLRALACGLLLIAPSLRAQSDDAPAHAAALTTLLGQADTLRQAYESYTGQSLKDPSNAGARRLSIKLDGLTGDLDAYLIGKADKKLLTGRLKEALTEAKRYKSKQAKALIHSIETTQQATTELPKRLTATQVQWVRNQATSTEVQTAEAKAEPAETESSSDAATEKGSDGNGTDGVERYADSGADATASGATEPAADASEAPAEEAPSRADSGSGSGWFGWVLFAVVIFNVGLLAALWAQGRQLTMLRQQLEDGLIALASPRKDGPRDNRTDAAAEAVGALRDEINGRWDELQRQTADFAHRLDARFRGVEEMGHRLSQSTTQLNNRLSGYEQLNETVARLDDTLQAQPKTNGNHAKPVDVPPALVGATAAPIGPIPSFSPTERELLIGLLDQLQATTALQPLSASARCVIEGFSPEASPDPVRLAVSPLQLAELVQLAYLSSLTESTEDLYRQVVELYKREQLLVEDKMVGRMAFSDFYAENYTLEQLRQLLAEGQLPSVWPTTAEALPIESVASSVAKNPLDRVAVKGTVLFTVMPAVLRQADGVKAVLRKGLYVIKG